MAPTDARRAVVVGAGPSGFYAASQLLDAGFEVDLLDALPTPFGLVRAGVAPDHPKIKTVTRVFDKVAGREGLRFFGGVAVGRDVTPRELVERYHAVVYAFGTAADNRLGIPGEDLPGSHAATAFVGWYNGHPDHAGATYDLSREHAVVIGNGNVAIDVARMLVLSPEEITPTDTADHAIEALAASSVREVSVVGRRGPVEAAFTTPELLELGELSRADVVVDHADLHAVPDDAGRNVEVLRGYAARPPREDASHRVVLRFCWSPVEILGEGRVEAIRLARNEIVDGRAVATGEEMELPCGLVVRSIGYRGTPIDGIPFDAARGLVRNVDGRVVDEDGALVPRTYVTGWVKRGPSGVIGTNKKDSAQTTAAIVADAQAGVLAGPPIPDADEAAAWLLTCAPGAVGWDGWTRLDAHEVAAGSGAGRPRVKVVHLETMGRIAASGV